MAERLQAMGQPNYGNGFKLTLQPQMPELPLGWKKARTIFVNSMSDLFQISVLRSHPRACMPGCMCDGLRLPAWVEQHFRAIAEKIRVTPEQRPGHPWSRITRGRRHDQEDPGSIGPR
jgi:hypothetical protein